MNSSSASPVGESGKVVLCKAADSSPFFLVRIGSMVSRTSFRLRYVTFQFDVRYEVDVGGPKIADDCVKIGCEDLDVFRQRVFVESINAVISDCGDSEPMVLVDALIELFSRSRSGDANTVTGVWGELLFMFSCPSCDEAVMAWHLESNQPRDFVFKEKAVEVKTSASGERRHHFSLSQITSAQAGDLLCSVMVEGTDWGLSLLDLASLVGDRCGSDAKRVFWSKFMPIADELSLGQGGPRYELDRAINSIRFFELAELNRPEVTPSGQGVVGEVKFSLVL